MKISLPTEIPATLEGLRDFVRTLAGELRRWADKNFDLRTNCRMVFVTTTSPVTTNTDIEVTHNLGVTPFMYFANIDKVGYVYDTDRSKWDSGRIFVRVASAASAEIRLAIFG